MDQKSELLLEKQDRIARITINRPDRRNALTNPLMSQLGEMIAELGQDSEIRAILLTSAGDKAFSAGADLTPGDTPFQPDFSKNQLPFANLLRAGKNSAVPIVGRINGTCVAGGMGLLGICDLAIAVDTARFGLPEAKIGIFPMQVVAVLRDLISPRVMADLCYTGRLVDAREALEMGLINKVSTPERFDQDVEAMLDDIRAVSPVAVRRGRYALRTMEAMSFEQMIAFAETQVGPMVLTEDAREGMKAFNERRKAVWPNR